MKLTFMATGWEDYLFWQKTDKATLKRVNRLLTATLRDPFEGIGKPEPLKYDFSGCWSRRIDQEHRFVYAVEDDAIVVIACRFHYE